MKRCLVVRLKLRLVLAVLLSGVILAVGLLGSGGGTLSWAAPGQSPHQQTVPGRPSTPEPEPPPAPPDDDDDDDDAPPPTEEQAPPSGGDTSGLAPFPGAVVINEIGWGGTAADAADQWVELFNITDQPINLTGWSLIALNGQLAISLTGIINAGDFFLLERTHDYTVSDVPADGIYADALDDGGDILQLLDVAGNLVDTANLSGGPWPAGSLGPGYYSMERVDPTLPDTPANWADNNGVIRNGLDAQSDPLNATPRQPNSNTLAPPGSASTPAQVPASSASAPTPTEPPTSPAPAPTPTEPPTSPAPAPTPTQAPTSSASSPMPTESTALAEETSATASETPMADMAPSSGDKSLPVTGKSLVLPNWLFALGLLLVVSGALLLRRS